MPQDAGSNATISPIGEEELDECAPGGRTGPRILDLFIARFVRNGWSDSADVWGNGYLGLEAHLPPEGCRLDVVHVAEGLVTQLTSAINCNIRRAWKASFVLGGCTSGKQQRARMGR